MWFQEAAARDQRRADALQQELSEWDALACARQDAAADAVNLELRPQQVDGAEKWAARVQDGRAWGALRRQLELPVGPAAARPVSAPCIQVLDPSVERSCAEPAAVSVAAPNSAQKQMETLPPVALVGLEPAEPDVLARQPASLPLGVQQPVVQRPEAREALLPVV